MPFVDRGWSGEEMERSLLTSADSGTLIFFNYFTKLSDLRVWP